jgi:thiol:disulfide interchange protein
MTFAVPRLLALSLLVLMAGPSAAVPVTAPHVRVELVAESAAVAPSSELSVGLRFVLEDGWHVYWQNPGDSGEEPRIAWTVPAGFAVGPLEWPAPERIPVGPLANYGYEHEVLLPARVHVPADLAGAASVAIGGRASWLVCDADECIPGAATLALELPTTTAAPAPGRDAARFVATRARVPAASPATWRLSTRGNADTATLVVDGYDGSLDPPPLFFPRAREVIEHAAPQRVVRTSGGFQLELARWTNATGDVAPLDGVLTVGGRSYDVSAAVAPAAASMATPLAFAFLGGLLLNLMPCVFPVLALKALGLVGLAGEDRRVARAHGLVYAAGVLASFWALAGLLLALRAGGASLGWGFQLQSPVVIAGLAGLFFWMAMLLLGVCTMGGSLMGIGNRLATAGGLRGAFASGVLATIVATPCTAPFMGTALGYALVQPPAVALAVFTALALGLALPYVAVTFAPGVARLLPRPGVWMESMAQALAFPLLATVVWLVWVASLQGGPDAVRAIAIELLLLGLAAWIFGRFRVRVARGLAIACLGLAVWVGTGIEPDASPRTAGAATDGLAWEAWTPARMQSLRAAGKPIFVDFTAAWCVTCQVNERVALAAPAVAAKMRALGVVPVRADWTRADPEIAKALESFGRQGVPLYVFYTGAADEPPHILPQLLTPEIVVTELEALEKGNRT